MTKNEKISKSGLAPYIITEQPVLGFFGPFRFLSNFVPVEVEFEGLKFPSVEHAYVAAKTLDLEARVLIAEVKAASQVKQLGRAIQLRPDWEEVKFGIMEDLLIQKFSQEPFLADLLSTGYRYLEETNHWGDVIWGVCNGVGENRLGHLLMYIRELLRSISKDEHR
jgi:ribA/ribD-fused uncharacterized protein